MMKIKKYLKCIILMAIGLLTDMYIDAQTLTIHVATAGTLSTLLGTNANTVTNLTLTGYLNGSDLNSCLYRNQLSDLNLAESNIVSGGDPYYSSGYSISGVYYSTTYYTKNNEIGTRTFYFNQNLKSIILPNSIVSIADEAFLLSRGLNSIIIPNKVTTIGRDAFANTRMTSVTIPNSVNFIGTGAFNYCIQLVEIHSQMKTPPTLGSSIVFRDLNTSNCILYVPQGTSQTYKNTEVWNNFVNIIEEETSTVIQSSSSNIIVYTEQDAIVLKGVIAGDDISVYNIFGAILKRVTATEDKLRIYVPTNNFYLVRIKDKNYKVSL